MNDDHALMRREIRFLAYTNLALILVICFFLIILFLWSARDKEEDRRAPQQITQEANPVITTNLQVPD